MRTLLITTGLFAFLLGLSTIGSTACSDDEPTGTGQPDAGGTFVCDPALSTPRGMLLNAPLDPTVQVINKTPRHPGDPGPDGLP